MSVSHLVRSQLDELLDPVESITPDKVTAECSRLVERLLLIVQTMICDEITHYARERDLPITMDTDSLTFSLSGNVYAIKMLEDPHDNFVLWVTLMPDSLAEPEGSMTCHEVELGDAGPYRRLRMQTDDRLAELAPKLSQLAEEAMRAGTQTIEAYAMIQLETYKHDFVEQLYFHLVRLFSHDIRQNLYLYLICPKAGGGLVMDSSARRLSLNKLRNAKYRVSRSPIELLCQVLEARFSVEQCVARHIVPEMRTYECSPLSIPSAARVGIIQSVLFENCHMVIQPLVYSDNIWVEVAYPATLRGLVERTLVEEREYFKMIVKTFEERGYYNLWGSKNKAEITQKIGSLMGAFIGSFLKYN